MIRALILSGLILVPAIVSADITPSDIFDAEIRIEQSLLAGDLEAFTGLYGSWSRELTRARGLQEGLSNVLQEEILNLEDVNSYTSQLDVQWSYVTTLQAQLQEIGRRVASRLARIEALKVERDQVRVEIREEDPLTGKWEITINPGDMQGTFHLKLSTTILVGSYTLSGGWKGSLRGTFIGDRIRLERIDSEKGFIAVYYGRLDRKEETITGTWESTMFTTGGPMTGTWSAHRIHEP